MILLVEDNPISQKLGLVQLKGLGYQVETVSSGYEAVRSVSQGHYALVLMDCQMPGMDGYEATAAIRQQEIETGVHIPIIALTANTMPGDREKCITAGMDDYLAKPVSPEDLHTMLQQWLTPL